MNIADSLDSQRWVSLISEYHQLRSLLWVDRSNNISSYIYTLECMHLYMHTLYVNQISRGVLMWL